MTLSKILAALMVADALIFAGCGESSSGKSASTAAGNGTDRAFVADMVPHHRSAVAMAKIAQDRGTSTFVKKLARDIIRTQTAEIDLHAAGRGRGTGQPAFIKMMLPHHQGAAEMAKAELKKGQDPELKTLARNIITAQQCEIAGMREHLGGSATDGTGVMSHGSSS